MSEEFNEQIQGNEAEEPTKAAPKKEKMSDEEQLKQAAKEFKQAWHDESWWEKRSLPEKIVMGIGFGLLFLGFLALLGFVTMWLWNWLMPEIFGLTTIDYWQTWGLLLLSFIFFKNWGGDSDNDKSSRRRKKHLKQYIKEQATEE
jgi:hypothetical protein